MTPKRLLEYFNEIAEAPEAVPRLRRFILDLAVRGKLVEQDPNDEPASELLERIQAEKARLVKKGIIRMPSPVASLDQTECLFDLPGSWQWIRLAETGSIIGGGTPPSKDSECFTEGGKGVAWLTPADLGKHKSLLISHGERDLTEKGLSSSSAQLMPAGSVLFTSRAPIGYTAIAENEISTNQGFKSVVPFIMDFNRYIAVYFKAFASWIDGNASGTTFKEVSGKIIANLPFPLPPLAEQHRIVAKVDELMALCDELEEAQQKRERRRDRLVAVTLNGIGKDVSPKRPMGRDGIGRDGSPSRPNIPQLNTGAFGESALPNHDTALPKFFLNHLPRLTTRPEHIQQLRQTILNLAVRGKLVPQGPNDEPASGLLKRIEAEPSDDVPFSIPKSWVWVPVGEIGDARLGKMLDKAKNKGTPRRYLRNVNVRWFDFNLSDVFEMPFEDDELDEFSLHGDDVLICEGGEPGRAAVWDQRENDIYFQKAIHRVRFTEGVNSHFFVYALHESAQSGRLSSYFTGVGIKHFTGKGLSSFVFPLPPLVEQHRIVAKVNELMALCDDLDTRLNSTAVTRHQLLEATLSEAIAR